VVRGHARAHTASAAAAYIVDSLCHRSESQSTREVSRYHLYLERRKLTACSDAARAQIARGAADAAANTCTAGYCTVPHLNTKPAAIDELYMSENAFCELEELDVQENSPHDSDDRMTSRLAAYATLDAPANAMAVVALPEACPTLKSWSGRSHIVFV
jgi:hypothetical protein